MGSANMTSEARQRSYEDWDETSKSALVSQIVGAKLSLAAAGERYGLSAEVIHDWLRLFRRSALFAFDEQLKQTLINQGADATVLAAAEFTGTLADISIADLIQSVQIAGKDAVITVTNDALESRIWCSAGAVVDAQSGRLTAEAAAYRILRFEQGRVVADLRSAPRARTINISTHRLLLEAAQRKDESALLWQKLGDGQCLYRIAKPATGARAGLSPAQLSLLALFDKPLSLREGLSQSELGDLETLKLLKRLIESRRLVVANVSAVSRSLAPRAAGVSTHSMAGILPLTASHVVERATRRGHWRGWFWGALGVLALPPAALWLRIVWQADDTPSRAADPMPSTPPMPLASPADRPSSYQVAARVEPAHAEIWLDRRNIASGEFSTVLSRDGTTHELRVIAEGYIPATLLFVDTAPPSEIRLETLPLPAPTDVTALGPVCPKPRVLRSAAASAKGRSPEAQRPVSPRPALPKTQHSDALKHSEPHPQGIERRAPKIQVIE